MTRMPVHNAEIAALFEEIAGLLEIQGENPFRIRAYRNAARSVGDLGTELAELHARGTDLTRLPGIGKDLAAQIEAILASGASAKLRALRKRSPAGVTALLAVPGLGPKRVKALAGQLGIHTLKQLERAAASGKIRALPGFGAKTEERIRLAVQARQGEGPRLPLASADQYAQALLAYLRQTPGVQQVEMAGSYRRAKETIGDLDILLSAESGSEVMTRFTHYDEVQKRLSQGPTRATVILRSGLQVDLRRVDEASFGAALQYFTGSKAHNIAVRRLARQRGLKLNEYGVFKGERRVAGETEASVYRALGLPPIAPELRENRGEIAAAQAGRLPRLIEFEDIKGDLHSHTRATDGRLGLKELALAAKQFGLRYLAITDHTRHLTVAKGLDAARLARQGEEIDRLNAELTGITLLKGIEVDILEDGRLDLPDAALAPLDIIVGAVHGGFNLSAKKQTERLIRAMNAAHFTVLAHPSGRLLGKREAYQVDMERVIREAGRRGCFLELNAQPQRLDLNDVYCKLAKSEGVLISLASDAHRAQDFEYLRWGVGQARRGWLEADDVVNTRPLRQLRALLRRMR